MIALESLQSEDGPIAWVQPRWSFIESIETKAGLEAALTEYASMARDILRRKILERRPELA